MRKSKLKRGMVGPRPPLGQKRRFVNAARSKRRDRTQPTDELVGANNKRAKPPYTSAPAPEAVVASWLLASAAIVVATRADEAERHEGVDAEARCETLFTKSFAGG